MKLRQACRRENDAVMGRMSHTESPALATLTPRPAGLHTKQARLVHLDLTERCRPTDRRTGRDHSYLMADVRVGRRHCLAGVGDRLSLAVGKLAGDLRRENWTPPSMDERRFGVPRRASKSVSLLSTSRFCSRRQLFNDPLDNCRVGSCLGVALHLTRFFVTYRAS